MKQASDAKQSWFLHMIETSRLFRLCLEISATLILLFWLPLMIQLVAGVVVTISCEIIFSKVVTKGLRNRFSEDAVSQMLENSQRR